MNFPKVGDVFVKNVDFLTIKRRVIGLNGLGCPWIGEQWIWPNGEVCRTESLSLDYIQTEEMLTEFTKYESPRSPQAPL